MSPLLSPVSPNKSTCGGTGNCHRNKNKTKKKPRGKQKDKYFPCCPLLTIFKECKTYFLDLQNKKRKQKQKNKTG